MVTVSLVMLLMAAGVGVCAFIGALDNDFVMAGVAAAMVALGTFLLPMPELSWSEAQRYIMVRFVGIAVVAMTLNICAVLIGRHLHRRQSRK